MFKNSTGVLVILSSSKNVKMSFSSVKYSCGKSHLVSPHKTPNIDMLIFHHYRKATNFGERHLANTVALLKMWVISTVYIMRHCKKLLELTDQSRKNCNTCMC